MATRYKAKLQGNYLKWEDTPPDYLRSEKEVTVYVTIVEQGQQTASEASVERMLAALDKLAALNALADIEDPLAWQREIRHDRRLPERDE